jgi:RNA polymerase sigma factor (sigma-70 family)
VGNGTTALLGEVGRFLGAAAGDASDAELLGRFVSRRDENAFTALLVRHGRLVLGVCRRVLKDPDDVEDAFQATFLVLVRRAAALDGERSLGPWLHTVAYHAALKARTVAARRRAIEEQARHAAARESHATGAWDDLRLVLDEELSRLPQKYRSPLVLCYLEGKTNEEAARLLGWTKGTVSGRLARARDLLRGRLSRRGLALSAPSLVLLVQQDASATVPVALVERTLPSAGQGKASAGVRALADGVAQTLTLTVRKVAVALLLVLLTTMGVAGTLLGGRTPVRPAPDRVPAAAASAPSERPAHADLHGDPLPAEAVARLGTLRLYHPGGFSIAYSADGRILASAGSGTIHLWDAATGRELRSFPGAGHFALSPDGKRLASSGDRNPERLLVRIWDTASGKELHRLPGHRDDIFALSFSPDGKILATGSFDSSLRLWDVARGRQVRVLTEGQGRVHFLEFTRDGRTLVSGEDRMTRLWEVSSGKERRRFPARHVRALSPDGQALALLADGGHTLALVRAATAENVWTVKRLPGAVQSACFSPDGKVLATAGHVDPFIRLWDAATGKPLRTIKLDNYDFSLAFAPDGRTLAAGVPWAAGERVRLWDPTSGTERFPRPGHQHTLQSVRFLAAGKTVATLAADRTCRLWRTADGKQLRRLPLGGDPLAVSPDGKLVATLEERPPRPPREGPVETAVVWDAATGKVRWRLEGHTGGIACAEFAPDRRTLAVATSRGEIHLWDVTTGKHLHQWKAAGIIAWAFAPSGRLLATGGRDCAVYLWETATGRLVRRLGKPLPDYGFRDGVPVEGTSSIAFSPDGKQVAAALVPQNAIHLWDAGSGKELRQFHGHPLGWHQGWVFALVFSPDGKTLFSGSKERTIRIWEVATGKERGQLRGHRGEVRALAVSADGTRLASGSLDCTALVWDLTARNRPR